MPHAWTMSPNPGHRTSLCTSLHVFPYVYTNGQGRKKPILSSGHRGAELHQSFFSCSTKIAVCWRWLGAILDLGCVWTGRPRSERLSITLPVPPKPSVLLQWASFKSPRTLHKHPSPPHPSSCPLPWGEMAVWRKYHSFFNNFFFFFASVLNLTSVIWQKWNFFLPSCLLNLLVRMEKIRIKLSPGGDDALPGSKTSSGLWRPTIKQTSISLP